MIDRDNDYKWLFDITSPGTVHIIAEPEFVGALPIGMDIRRMKWDAIHGWTVRKDNEP